MTREQLKENISKNKIKAYKFAMSLLNGDNSEEVKIYAASCVLAANDDEVVEAAMLAQEEID